MRFGLNSEGEIIRLYIYNEGRRLFHKADLDSNGLKHGEFVDYYQSEKFIVMVIIITVGDELSFAPSTEISNKTRQFGEHYKDYIKRVYNDLKEKYSNIREYGISCDGEVIFLDRTGSDKLHVDVREIQNEYPDIIVDFVSPHVILV